MRTGVLLAEPPQQGDRPRGRHHQPGNRAHVGELRRAADFEDLAAAGHSQFAPIGEAENDPRLIGFGEGGPERSVTNLTSRLKL